MNISVLSVYPSLYKPFFSTGIVARALENQLFTVDVADFFAQAQPKERIDAPTFGPGPGMLIKPTVVEAGITALEKKHGTAHKIFFSPHGKKVDQRALSRLAALLQEKKHLLFVAGRYEGMDTRVEDYYADELYSIGDFVLMGGDLPTMVVIEGLLRLIPEVIGKKESVERDSFVGPFVDYPEYTQPVVWKDMEVPDIIRSGNHAAIESWRQHAATTRTVTNHFSWLRSFQLTAEQKHRAYSSMPSHYAAIMHTDVLLPNDLVGTTSVTTIDIHDGARSAKTYGLKKYYIVTPLRDQQAIATTLLDFWQQDVGKEYNIHRHEAIKLVSLQADLAAVKQAIYAQEGQEPLVIATSAKLSDEKMITYDDQEKVWQTKKPVLFLFGTGKGLAPYLIDQADYVLMPIEGFTEFNHLSVRTAMGVIFDRWLGINVKRR